MGSGPIRTAFAALTAISAFACSRRMRGRPWRLCGRCPDISEVGSCKVERLDVRSDNTDFSLWPILPAWLTSSGRGIEACSQQVFAATATGGTNIVPKAKTNLVPTGSESSAFSFYAGGQFDALTGENLSAICGGCRDL